MPIIDMSASGASTSSGSASLTARLALLASGASTSSGSASLRVATGTRVTQVAGQADTSTDVARVTQVGLQSDSSTDVTRVTMFGLQVDGQKRSPQRVTQFGLQADSSTSIVQVTQVGLQVDGRFSRPETTVNCWEFHVTDRAGRYLAFLDSAYDKAYLAQLNDVGAGSFRIHALDPKATAENLAVGNVVLVRYRNVDVGAFVIEEVREDLVGEQEEQGKVITVSGRGLMALLEDGIVYPTDFSDQSTWERSFTSTPAAIFLTLYGEYQARGGGELSYDFTATHDSNLEPWTSTVTVKYRAGQTLLDVVRNHVGFGVDVTVSPDRVLHYWKSAGEDKSDRVFFRQGLNILSCTRTRDGKALANVVLGEGQDVLVESTDADSIAQYGRKEAHLSARNTDSASQVNQDNVLFLDQYSDPVESLTLQVTSDEYFPLLSYGLGDTVRVEIPGHVLGDYRILSVSIREKDSPCDLLVELEVASLRLDYLHRLQRLLEAQRSLNEEAVVIGLAAMDTREMAARGHTHREADITDLGATVVKDGDAASGDLSGSYPGPTVARIQGRPVSSAAPADGDVLTWDQADGQWEPRAAAGGGTNPRQWFLYFSGQPSISTSTYLTKGFVLEPTSNVVLLGIGAVTDEATTQSLRLRVYRLSGNVQQGAALVESDLISGPGEISFVHYKFSTAITLSAGNRYVVALSNVTSGATLVRIGFQAFTSHRLTGFKGGMYARINNANPGSGATWEVVSGNPFSGGVMVEI
jgi:hypothetical protein